MRRQVASPDESCYWRQQLSGGIGCFVDDYRDSYQLSPAGFDQINGCERLAPGFYPVIDQKHPVGGSKLRAQGRESAGPSSIVGLRSHLYLVAQEQGTVFANRCETYLQLDRDGSAEKESTGFNGRHGCDTG
jgi:hypothetical protein